MSAQSPSIDRALVRQHRIAVLAKRLLATAPLYDAGLPMEHRPLDRERCEELALAVAFLVHATGGDITAYATLHQLEPDALHETAPRLVAQAWRRLVASGPAAEARWHRDMALQIQCIAHTLPRKGA